MTLATQTSYQNWTEVQAAYPNQWILVEALGAHSEKGRRVLDKILVIETCEDWLTAMRTCNALLREFPNREVYFANTEWVDLEIHESQDWRVRVPQT